MKITDIMKKYLDVKEEISTGSVDPGGSGIFEPYGDNEKERKKKRKEYENYFLRKKSLKESIATDDIINMFGGEKFFKGKFKKVEDALAYIKENLKQFLKTFNFKEADVPWREITEKLKKFIK